MKTLLILLGLAALLIGCSHVEPEEKPATILVFEMPPATSLCACCGGYRIQVGNTYYYANEVPTPYNGTNTSVWIRYKPDADHCANVAGRIQITSIRSR